MTTFALYPIEKIQPHPRNVRRVAVASDEMVDSIRSAGILEPVVLGPEGPDGVRDLIAGNRRWDGAVKAGLTTLPAVLRDDLVTEAQQIEAMLVENLHRADLTAVEEAEAYHQLELFGMDDKAIAAATGRSVKTVKARRRLVDLTAGASEKLHAGEITLADAEALLEFEDDHEAYAALEKELGTSNFQWRVRDVRARRDRVARNAAVVEGFKDQGAVAADGDEWQRLSSFWTKDLQDPAGHTHCECLGYIDYGPDSYSQPQLVCLDPESHADDEAASRANLQSGGSATVTAEQRAEWEAQQAAREAARAAAFAAVQTRIAWLRSFFTAELTGKKAPVALGQAAAAVLPVWLTIGRVFEYVEWDVLADALEIEDPGVLWNGGKARLDAEADEIQAGSASRALGALAAVLAAVAVDTLEVGAEDETEARRQLFLWDWMISAGYPMADPDKAQYARVEEAIAEYADEGGEGE